jgi:hypothetical protein
MYMPKWYFTDPHILICIRSSANELLKIVHFLIYVTFTKERHVLDRQTIGYLQEHCVTGQQPFQQPPQLFHLPAQHPAQQSSLVAMPRTVSVSSPLSTRVKCTINVQQLTTLGCYGVQLQTIMTLMSYGETVKVRTY